MNIGIAILVFWFLVSCAFTNLMLERYKEDKEFKRWMAFALGINWFWICPLGGLIEIGKAFGIFAKWLSLLNERGITEDEKLG